MKVTLRLTPQMTVTLDWNFTEDYIYTARKKYLLITPELNHNLKGRVEIFFVTFLDQRLIKDNYQNSLMTEVVSGPATRKIIISDAVDTSGNVFSIANYIALILTILLSGKSNPAFWIFVSMIQMLSYLPLLNCSVSGNLKHFIKTYFGASKASIPFDSFPSWVPNPTSYINRFIVPPNNIEAIELGYISICFLYNFGYQLFTWITVLMMYGLFFLASKLPYNKL